MLIEAVGLGLLAQSSLFLAGLLVCWITVPTRVVGILAGFGAGAMIAAIAFELVPEGQTGTSELEFAAWMLIGVAVFLVGDAIVERRFGDDGAGRSMGIVVGSVVDGIPESIIFGIQIGAGMATSPSFLVAVFVSNIPQAIAPSADLRADGWSARRLGTLWGVVVISCGVAAGLGFLATQVGPDVLGSRMAALAAGGLLAMLTNSLIPFAYERGGSLAGAATAVGFLVPVLNGAATGG